MTGYFSAIQSWFSEKNEGRHLALILRETGKWHPEAINNFVSESLGLSKRELRKCIYETEYTFNGKKGYRRADLAVIPFGRNEPIALIEIKYRDKPLCETDDKPAQLEDYAFWKSQDSDHRHVLVISREALNDSRVVIRRWRDFAHFMRRHVVDSELVAMLIEYLENEGVVMQDINERALLGFMKRILCADRGAGMLANNLDGPTEFSALLQNMRNMASTFDGNFKRAWEEAGEGVENHNASRCATIDFFVRNKIFENKADNIIKVDGFIDNSAKNGGSLIVLARYSFGHGHGQWLRISFGAEFFIEPKSSVNIPPKANIFAEIYGGILWEKDEIILKSKKVSFDKLVGNAEKNTGKVEEDIRALLVEAIRDLLGGYKKLLTTEQKKAATALLKFLGQ